jgi:hypothetical protein
MPLNFTPLQNATIELKKLMPQRARVTNEHVVNVHGTGLASFGCCPKKLIQTEADKNEREKRKRDKEQKKETEALHDKTVLDGRRVTKKKPAEKARHHYKQNGRAAENSKEAPAKGNSGRGEGQQKRSRNADKAPAIDVGRGDSKNP